MLRDQLVLALERGSFTEPIPGMTIYVSDKGEQPSGGIFISDGRIASEPRVIVAQDYRVLIDSASDQVALRLQDGVIHTKPDEIDEYQLASFSSYDLKLSLNQSGYASTEERPSYDQLVARAGQPHLERSRRLRSRLERAPAPAARTTPTPPAASAPPPRAGMGPRGAPVRGGRSRPAIPLPPECDGARIKVISVAPLFAEAIMRIHKDLSLSALFS